MSQQIMVNQSKFSCYGEINELSIHACEIYNGILQHDTTYKKWVDQ